MKKTTILAHAVPLDEGWFAHQSATVLQRFGITLVILATDEHVEALLREGCSDPRYQIRRLQ